MFGPGPGVSLGRRGHGPAPVVPAPGRGSPGQGMTAGQMPGRPGRLLISCLRGRRSGAEVRDRRGTADALNPDVLDAGDVGCDVAGGDDHLCGEGLVVTVTG